MNSCINRLFHIILDNNIHLNKIHRSSYSIINEEINNKKFFVLTLMQSVSEVEQLSYEEQHNERH